MKRLLIATAAAAAFLCAAAIPVMSSPAFDTGPALAAPALVQDVAAPSLENTCALVIHEDRATCTFTIVAVAGTCRGEVGLVLERAGARMLASDAYLSTCLGQPPAPSPD